MSDKLSHVDASGQARMVDVGDKPATQRSAVAEAMLRFPPALADAIRDGSTPKGNIFETARLAGIMAAKRTDELIPLCHTVPLTHVAVDFEATADSVRITASAKTLATTGVEMEALVAASTAALTLYDMLKALDHGMIVEGLRLLEKTGGKSGDYHAPR